MAGETKAYNINLWAARLRFRGSNTRPVLVNTISLATRRLVVSVLSLAWCSNRLHWNCTLCDSLLLSRSFISPVFKQPWLPPFFLFKYLGTDMKFDGFNINTCREMISLLDVSFKCHIFFFFSVLKTPLPFPSKEGGKGRSCEKKHTCLSYARNCVWVLKKNTSFCKLSWPYLRLSPIIHKKQDIP